MTRARKAPEMEAQLLPLFDLPSAPAASRRRRPAADAPVPASLDLMTAAALLGVGRTCAYAMVRSGRWPTPTLRVGRSIRVPTRPLLEALGAELGDFHRLVRDRPAGS